MAVENPLVTICIPHWQVRELITICLRAIRKFTRNIPIQVLVIDNGSEDDSLDYLRSLKWIKLIERGKLTPEYWVRAFTTALDIGMEQCQSDYFIIMHTDTIVARPDWLETLLAPLQQDPLCAAAGAWKLEANPMFYELLKKATDTKKLRLWLRRTILGDEKVRPLPRELCPRDYCTLYRAEPIRRYGLKFGEERYPGYTAGEQMYYQLKDHGFHAHVFPARQMMDYMIHIAHATAGLRPEQRRLNHSRAQRKVQRKLRRLFGSDLFAELAADSTLDQAPESASNLMVNCG